MGGGGLPRDWGHKKNSAFLLYPGAPQTFNGGPPDEVGAIVPIYWKRTLQLKDTHQYDY